MRVTCLQCLNERESLKPDYMYDEADEHNIKHYNELYEVCRDCSHHGNAVSVQRIVEDLYSLLD